MRGRDVALLHLSLWVLFLIVSLNLYAVTDTSSFLIINDSIADKRLETDSVINNNTEILVDSSLKKRRTFNEIFLDSNAFIRKLFTPSAKKLARNFRVGVLVGPGYTPDYGFSLGFTVALTFKTNKQDTNAKRSIIPIVGAVLIPQWGTVASIRPQLFFLNDRIRLSGLLSFKYATEYYHGVGYETNKSRERKNGVTSYLSSFYQINPIVSFRIAKSDVFISSVFDLSGEWVDNPSETIYKDETYIAQGGTENGYETRNVGVGLAVSYDCRDYPPNAYKGFFIEAKYTYYSKYFGGENNYGVFKLDYRHFFALPFIGKRTTIGWIYQANLVHGDVPFTRLPLVGSPFDIRGFYSGQLRDKMNTSLTVEYRQMINAGNDTWWQKLLSRFGFAVWGAVSVMGPNYKQLNFLPVNFGAGLRLEILPRTNVRFDMGYNPFSKKMLMYFNITEAF